MAYSGGSHIHGLAWYLGYLQSEQRLSSDRLVCGLGHALTSNEKRLTRAQSDFGSVALRAILKPSALRIFRNPDSACEEGEASSPF